LSSHWDREWYLTFQSFRFHLVRLFDAVLEGLSTGSLAGPFVTDGQAILLEDYLEIRPEQRPLVEQLLRQGKLVAGPWYVMPDELIVSGEALIRNLEFGRRLVRSLGGKPSDAGFVCDVFGHNSQMPQILEGFGIGFAYLWRGANLVAQRNFRWRGADGTEILGYRFGRRGYCDFAARVRHIADGEFDFELEKAADDLEEYLREETEHSGIDPILVFDGGDHIFPDPRVDALITQFQHGLDPGIDLIHSSLDAYQAEALAHADGITPLLEGELREPGVYPEDVDQQDVIPGVLSSRVWIKQANAECQAALCCRAEPLSALAAFLTGRQTGDAGFLDTAWRWLLQNHPHDSICGCSIDAVHEGMRYRFAQSREIADSVAQARMSEISALAAGGREAGELRIAVFNPLPYPFNQTAELTLDFPADWPTATDWFSPEALPAFRIFDAQGREIPHQVLSCTPNRTRFSRSDVGFPKPRKVSAVRVSLPVAVPPLGYTTLTARTVKDSRAPRFSVESPLKAQENRIANESLRVEVAPDGSLTLTDLETNSVYRHLLTFEDRADIGNGYNFRAPAADQIVYSSVGPADVSLVHAGPHLASLLVRQRLRVPARFDFETMQRSTQMEELTLESRIDLRPGQKFVEVETALDNTAADHRLRLLFPSGAASAQSYFTDTPFDVVERPILPPENAAGTREPDPLTRPQQSWCAVWDGQRGLAVVAPGLMEVAVEAALDRPIALTLFRSTRRTVFSDGEPGGLLLGPLQFKFVLYPLARGVDRTDLSRLGQRILTGLPSVQPPPGAPHRDPGQTALPPTLEFLRVDGGVVVTSTRQTGQGFEVRFFNPTSEPATATITLAGGVPGFQGFETAEPVDFEHRPVGQQCRLQDRAFSIEAGPKKIVTVRFS
jgi:alpha-mannosidase/mannosylglycerate hydrolase